MTGRESWDLHVWKTFFTHVHQTQGNNILVKAILNLPTLNATQQNTTTFWICPTERNATQQNTTTTTVNLNWAWTSFALCLYAFSQSATRLKSIMLRTDTLHYLYFTEVSKLHAWYNFPSETLSSISYGSQVLQSVSFRQWLTFRILPN